MNEPTTKRDTAIDALVAMDHRLAGLTAAIDGFAAKQQELLARDYSPELAEIEKSWEQARKAFQQLAAKPALALTPEQLASEIDHASATIRKADHEALNCAQQDLRQVTAAIGSVVASARIAHDQNRWLAGVAMAAMVVGFILGTIVPGVIDHAMPASWYWPERRAADVLGLDGWTAGERLMQVANPRRWQEVSMASQLYTANTGALAKCADRAAKQGQSHACTIQVGLGRNAAGR